MNLKLNLTPMVLPSIDSPLEPVNEFLERPGEIIVRRKGSDRIFMLNYTSKTLSDGETTNPNFTRMIGQTDALLAAGRVDGINPLVQFYGELTGRYATLCEIMPEYTLARLCNLDEGEKSSLGKIVRTLHQKDVANLGLKGRTANIAISPEGEVRIHDSRNWITKWSPNPLDFCKGYLGDITHLREIGQDDGIQIELFK